MIFRSLLLGAFVSVIALGEVPPPGPDDDYYYQLTEIENLFPNGNADLHFVNDGATASIGSNLGPSTATSICVNVYEFDPTGSLLGCCACPLAPNASLKLSVRTDPVPRVSLGDSVVVKVLFTTTNTTGPVCTPGSLNPSNFAQGIAWATTLEKVGAISTVVKSPFRSGNLSEGEFNVLTGSCAAINGGLCASCGGPSRVPNG